MRQRALPDYILITAEPSALGGSLVPGDVPGLFQLQNGSADGVLALLVDVSEARKGVVPFLRQGKHLGQQPLGFQGQVLIPQMIIAHDGEILCFFYAKYSHNFSSCTQKGRKSEDLRPSVYSYSVIPFLFP